MTDILITLSRLQEWRNLLDIALVSLIFYGLLQLFRGTQAIQLVRGILVIVLATAVPVMAPKKLRSPARMTAVRMGRTPVETTVAIAFAAS